MGQRLIVLLVTIFCFQFSALAGHPTKKTKELDSINWNSLIDKNLSQLSSEFGIGHNRAEMEHMRWVAKASLFLRGRRPLSFTKDDIEKLKLMSKREVVDLFLKEDTFYNSLLDFSLFYLGFKADQLMTGDGEINPQLFKYSQAINGVLAVHKGGSFDNLYSELAPDFLPPLGPVKQNLEDQLDLPDEYSQLATDHEKRLFFIEWTLSEFESFQSLSEEEFVEKSPEICTLVGGFYPLAFGNISVNFTNRLGYSSEIVQKIRNVLHQGPVVGAFPYCAIEVDGMNFKYVITDVAGTKEFLQYSPRYLEGLKSFSEEFSASFYKVKNIGNIKSLPESVYGKELIFKKRAIHSLLQNSSTNMNRKRAAYILERYFCDDLTPVNVELPYTLVGGSHGSNPSCFACHYKLDPMAGFFRDYGLSFTDYSQFETITFDDFVTQNREDYQSQWLKPNSDKWNVGYIKSPSNDYMNQYGESLGDLFQIIKKSPDVKRCMVKRLFQFATSPHQLIDPGFIDEVANRYQIEIKTEPKTAIKNLFRTVALSKTFSEQDPIQDQCYDKVTQSGDRPPCAIAHILDTSCKVCHNSTKGINTLDLSRWIQLPEGSFGFPHINSSTDKQYSPNETIKRMLNRITTTDKSQRMPLGSDMDPIYRQTLYRWLNERLSE